VYIVFQSELQHSVTAAAQLLLFDPSKFIVPMSFHSVVPRFRSNLSTQFSEMAPKVISFDPSKPIRMHRDESAHIAQFSHLHVVSTTSYAPRPSSISGVGKDLVDVRMSPYAVLSVL